MSGDVGSLPRDGPSDRRAQLDIAYEVELKAIWPTIQMESTGLFLDRARIDEQMLDLEDTRKTALAAFVEELDTELQDAGEEGLPKLDDGRINLNKKTTGSVRLGTKVFAGFNPGSSQQLLARFKEIGIEPCDPRGKPSVDKKFLASYTSRSVIKQYLSWKRADKHLQMCKTLIDAQQEDGRIYARFNQTGTFTGRYSSSGPTCRTSPAGICVTASPHRKAESWWIWTTAGWSFGPCARRASPTRPRWPTPSATASTFTASPRR